VDKDGSAKYATKIVAEHFTTLDKPDWATKDKTE